MDKAIQRLAIVSTLLIWAFVAGLATIGCVQPKPQPKPPVNAPAESGERVRLLDVYAQHREEVNAVWAELGEDKTLGDAVREWERRQKPTPADPETKPAEDPPHEDHSIIKAAETPAPGPMGYIPNDEGTKEFLQSLDKPTIRDAGPQLFQGPRGPPARPLVPQMKDSGEPVLLYRALFKAFRDSYRRDWETVNQEIGDCVSHGWAHGVAIASAVEYVEGNVGEWKMPASESIYGGARVEGSGKKYYGGGDGSYGGAAARWVHEKGGILFREAYDGHFDLTKYSGKRAKEWGAYGCGGKGDSGWADAKAKEHPVLHVALVTNFTEAAAAIASGYPVPVCSGQGFSQRRDKDGFDRPSGSWAHCMCFVGVRYDRRGLLCLNSWGPNSCTGPVWPDDQIPGSFWVDEKTVNSMLRGEDSFAVSATDGFPLRPLSNTDWLGRADAVEPQFVLAP